ncbi:hypothetical protein [Promicromonospora sp. NPDC050262]|uniref:hypothetical protein n=1 Tax=Promicromonospora sp. NPDC050262 TaxID=3155036 RepID=UPI0033C4BCFF
MTHTILNIKRATLTIDAVDCADAATDANLALTDTVTNWQPISGNDQTDLGDAVEVINVSFGQDLSSADTCHATLLAAHGLVVPVVLKPTGAVTHPSVTALARVGAVSAVGGARGVATATCVLHVQKEDGGVGAVVTAADGTQVYPAPVTP